MIVKEEDSLRKKMKWSLITFVTEIVILLIFCGVPFFIMKDNEFLGVILFLIGVWISRKLCFFLENDIIAGDFHIIKKFMPDKLPGKIIITNTVTTADREMLRKAGVKLLVTTTPCLDGRSFGTNVMEALLVALAGGKEALSADKYLELLERYHIGSSIEALA